MVRVNAHSVLKCIDGELKKLEKYALSFPEIFAKEEKAVIQHDILSLEKVGAKKHELLSGLQESLSNLVYFCSQLSESQNISLSSFTEIKDYLTDFIKQIVAKNQVLVELLSKIIRSLDQLISLYQEIKPKIEKNRFIIARLLHHHQESYRFWSELKKENSSNYNSRGAKKNQSTISQLFAKA